ncbi:hypothetical protein MPTK1_7g06070 [Marchantia polymorpha subsp. ruderalis]|uniref:Uncharacterized protein n=2 Tax=Marchantia polymorpha TaxID=3197 RepID=A0A176VJN6_MARPO|nr:hypothetical protein AXG93_517s1380 [Marchantia polymorpha subsp. ruderalis]PTQ37429.1 hypothetical protein MARPO_0057s0064 [Marchantia polymorpha]BBN16413.1 hypothetical protein Mp_7g06070 [Marchantia polymorpha subsp. ruderalis]|eukprot:PTQ37429.1 hypothetical protein MARPO_0057s0064 [Marchantia polymorpha]
MAKPWGGSWAQEAEQAEAEAKMKGATSLPAEAFPSLVESVATKPKKKKATTLSISQFTTGTHVGPGGKSRQISDSQRLTTEEMFMLPTAPRDRTNEEIEAGGLGGGFRDYGGNRGGGGRLGFGDRGAGDREPRGERGFGGGFDRDREERRGMGRDRDPRDDGPSRADEADNWGASKKTSLPSSYVGSGGGGRGGGGYDDDRSDRGGRMSDRDLPSRADEDANWGTSKKSVPAPVEGFGDRRGGRGGGFEERRSGGGFEDAPGGISRADEVSNWGAAKKSMPTTAPPERRGGGGGFDTSYRDAGPEADRWSRREAPSARDDLVRPAERRRLVLQPRSIPVETALTLPLLIDRNGENERPHSSHSTRSDRSVAVSENSLMGDGVVAKSKPRSNPFGAARPREDVLAEKGQDWRKLDAEFDSKAEKFSRPSSSHSSRSSRPQTPEVGAGEGLPKSRSRVSPFGDARPRERDSYEDRGNRDWRKFDVDLQDRPGREQVKAAPEENNNVEIVS